MLSTLLLLALSQAPRVAVVDVSAPDAIYEDESRELAEMVVAALGKAGFEALRVDETEIPGGKRCSIGPCLGEVARMVKAHVVVALDAAEVKKHTDLILTALLGFNGEPLCAKRFTVGSKDADKKLAAFTKDLVKVAAKKFPKPDAGR